MLYLTGPRHITVATAGTVLTALGVGSMLSQPIGGVLTDRYGRRATLAASLTATAAMLLCLSMARSRSTIVAAVFVLGLFAEMYRPASMAAVADLVDEDHRKRAYALQFWAINLGFSIASITAGVLVHHGYGLLFVLDAATTVAFAWWRCASYLKRARSPMVHMPVPATHCGCFDPIGWSEPGSPRPVSAGLVAAFGQRWLLGALEHRPRLDVEAQRA